ncbi:Multifunctional conjugation protein TraI [Posidoniimonas corsicana]|uniref:Multifunctional conjugation protein TraI n=1 Tax=Posidoniimonas corsicana TaxID=1938618 RepID=A0A5C5VGW0_9BACT|nr:MobF family relaxase [Posidoniimonas corsicana]TWT37180.1 Multifunctional conjugation protein TraI [Posidoniimonas corsicana]
MLSISKIGGGDAVAYYASLSEQEGIVGNYYSNDGKRPGRWFGAGAAALGLSGDIDLTSFTHLLEGRSPDGQSDLVQQRNGDQLKRRAGFDLTFSVPKSYSVLWSQVSDEKRAELDRIAEQALQRTLELVQAECGKTRRGRNGAVVEEGKLIGAIFKHDTARAIPGEAPDCNVHYHCVLANVVIRGDGTAGTLDARTLFERRKKVALGSMFRAELAALLRNERGIETYRPIKPGKKEPVSWFEIRGVPIVLLEAMSKRRSEIEAWLRTHGLSGARAAEKANLSTRRKKETFSWQALSKAWLELGHEHGWSRADADALMTQSLSDRRPAKTAEQLARQSLAMVMQNRARFTRNELMERAAIEAQTTGPGIDGVLKAIDLTLSNTHEVVRLQDKDRLATFTTREMLQLERDTLNRALTISHRSDHAVELSEVASVAVRYPTLRRDQREAVRTICTGSDCVSITGIAGSGKTYMLGVTREVLSSAGYTLVGTALAADAAKGLEEGAGIESTHLHKLLYDLNHGYARLTDETVVVLDEAGMVGTRQLAELMRRVDQAKAKLVMVGDALQLQPVDAGAPFRAISEAIGTTELGEIVRQRDAYARQVVRDLRSGRAQDALRELFGRGQVAIEREAESTREKLVGDWERFVFEEAVPLGEVAVLCGMNEDVRDLNRRLQAVMRRRGELGDYRLELDGLEFSLGDRVAITRNHRLLGARNGERGEVVGASGRTLWVKLESGFEIEIDTEEFAGVTLDYAKSIHRSQGKTAEHTLFLTGDVMTALETSYVAGSRARDKTFVYSHLSAVESIDCLAAMMNESRQNEMASEYVLEPE